MCKMFFLECNCNTSGTIGSSTTCSDTTGQCSCDTGYTGIDCDECEADFYLSDFNTCTSNTSTKIIV